MVRWRRWPRPPTGVAALGISLGGLAGNARPARVTPALYYLLPSFRRRGVEAAPGLSSDIFCSPRRGSRASSSRSLPSSRMYGLDPTNPDQKAFELLRDDAGGRVGAPHPDRKTRAGRPQVVVVHRGDQWKRRAWDCKSNKDADGNPRFDLSDDDVRNDWKSKVVKKTRLHWRQHRPLSGRQVEFHSRRTSGLRDAGRLQLLGIQGSAAGARRPSLRAAEHEPGATVGGQPFQGEKCTATFGAGPRRTSPPVARGIRPFKVSRRSDSPAGRAQNDET